MTTGDPWIDAKTEEGKEVEHKVGRRLEKPVQAGCTIECILRQEGRAYIDDLHYFNVPEEAWKLSINGYQIAAK